MGWHADNSIRSCRSARAWFESCAFAIIMLETFVRLVDAGAPVSVWSPTYILYLYRSTECRRYRREAKWCPAKRYNSKIAFYLCCFSPVLYKGNTQFIIQHLFAQLRRVKSAIYTLAGDRQSTKTAIKSNIFQHVWHSPTCLICEYRSTANEHIWWTDTSTQKVHQVHIIEPTSTRRVCVNRCDTRYDIIKLWKVCGFLGELYMLCEYIYFDRLWRYIQDGC